MHTNPMERRTRLFALVVACASAIFVAPGGLAQPPDGVVPITSEPNHKIRFDNGKVRMYEVFLVKGNSTVMHEHKADSFSVIFTSSVITNEPLGKASATFPVPAGFVGFSSTAMGPYSHRIATSKDKDFHVIAMELMSPKPDGPASVNQRADPPFQVVRENSRGRVYRIRLAPGESTGPYARPGSTGVFAISAGRISEEFDGKAKRIWDFETGQFRWMDSAEGLTLKNEGAAPVDLVEIEVF